MDVTLYCEYHDGTKVPVCLIETAIDNGQQRKPAQVTARLAQMAGLLAFCVLYTRGTLPLPGHELLKDITRFRVRQLAPAEEYTWTTYTPEAWARHLLALRDASRQFRPPEELVQRQLDQEVWRCDRCHLVVPTSVLLWGECERCRAEKQP